MTSRLALVCGGRNYNDLVEVTVALDRLAPVVVITGGCRDLDGNPKGADMLAGFWAVKRRVRLVEVPATWGPSFDIDDHKNAPPVTLRARVSREGKVMWMRPINEEIENG